MAYSNSTHFSDQNSYKILFIPSYHSKDINLKRYKHSLEFFRNRERWDSSHQNEASYQAGADAAHEAGTFLTGQGRARDDVKWSQQYTCIQAKRNWLFA
jgi:hypothetical protein